MHALINLSIVNKSEYEPEEAEVEFDLLNVQK